MKQGYKGKIWKDENGDLIAFNLGADYCAEHEWGIGGIIGSFGVDPNRLGIEGKIIRKKSDSVLEIEADVREWSINRKRSSTKKLHGIGTYDSFIFSKERDPFRWQIDQSYWDGEKDEIKSFWSDSLFFLMVEEKKLVDQLANAFERLDVAFWIGGGGPFSNGGLCIAIASKLPAEFTQAMLEEDIDRVNLQKAAEQTGIHEILKKHDKEYFALSPRWKDEMKQDVRFWLNPRKQDKYNFGWYSVDELKQWTEEKGPVIKEKS